MPHLVLRVCKENCAQCDGAQTARRGARARVNIGPFNKAGYGIPYISWYGTPLVATLTSPGAIIWYIAIDTGSIWWLNSFDAGHFDAGHDVFAQYKSRGVLIEHTMMFVLSK